MTEYQAQLILTALERMDAALARVDRVIARIERILTEGRAAI